MKWFDISHFKRRMLLIIGRVECILWKCFCKLAFVNILVWIRGSDVSHVSWYLFVERNCGTGPLCTALWAHFCCTTCFFRTTLISFGIPEVLHLISIPAGDLLKNLLLQSDSSASLAKFFALFSFIFPYLKTTTVSDFVAVYSYVPLSVPFWMFCKNMYQFLI